MDCVRHRRGFGIKTSSLMESGSGRGAAWMLECICEWCAMLMRVFMGAGFFFFFVQMTCVYMCVCVCVRSVVECVRWGERQTAGSRTSGPHACIHQSLGERLKRTGQ